LRYPGWLVAWQVPGLMEAVNTDRAAYLFQQRLADGTGFGSALLQHVFDVVRTRQQVVITLAGFPHIGINSREQAFLGIAPANTVGVGLTHFGGLFSVGKSLVNLEHGGGIRVFRLARFLQVGNDLVDVFLKLFFRQKQRNGVAVAFAHFAAVQPLQYGDVIVDLIVRQR